ncbi:MAG: hypothetical protein ACM31C_13020, partial [Acidobacteriota bacterium]
MLVVLLASACVTTGTYNRKVAELTKQREQDAAAAKTREQGLQDQLDKTQKSYVELQTKLVDVQAALDKANVDKNELQKHLDDGTQLVETL